MSAYKQLSTKDVIITPYFTNKGFSFYGGEITGSNNENGINILFGYQPPPENLITLNGIPIPPKLFFSYNYNSLSQFSNLYWKGAGNYVSVSGSFNISGLTTKINNFLVYSSVKHLFYTNFRSSSWGDNISTQSLVIGSEPSGNTYIGGVFTPNFENYLQNTLPQSRSLALGEQFTLLTPITNGYINNNQCTVISIPSKLYGEAIEPQSFRYAGTSSNSATDDLFRYDLYDDGNGNIFTKHFSHQDASTYPEYNLSECLVGSIFYDKGLVILPAMRLQNSQTGSGMSEPTLNGLPNIVTSTIGSEIVLGQSGYPPNPLPCGCGDSKSLLTSASIHFSSSVRIYEHQYKCSIRENEFNYSLNPSLLSSSLQKTLTTSFTPDPLNPGIFFTSSLSSSLPSEIYSNFATGSFFTPYITTVGLYDNNQQLLAIGKLSRPTKIPSAADLTIIVNYDM